MKKLLTCLLAALLLCSCANSLPPADLPTSGDQPAPAALPAAVSPEAPHAADAAAMAEFALDLLRKDDAATKNALVSPLSIVSALGMTALGAKGETLSQMEDVMGLSLPRLRAILPALSAETDAFGLANAIWYHKDAMTVNDAFSAACRDEFGAPMHAAPMDESTRANINAFVDETTRGMIPELLPSGVLSPTDTAMVLVNALAFEADWKNAYDEKLCFDGEFEGITSHVRYLCATEERYLSGKNATGFLRPYAGDRYAFAAILPDEGVGLDAYLADLDGDALIAMLNSATTAEVMTRLPKFSYDYDIELSRTLADLGMPNAFDGTLADFSGMGHDLRGNLCIGSVIHKTHIALSETGTEAAAATAVKVVAETYNSNAPQPKYVYLTRPFLYAILDTETGCPIFVGTVTDPS